MWLESDIPENHPLLRKIEYMTMQSCERKEAEIYYKNINRKYITFDLRDGKLMALVGETLEPFGLKQSLEHQWLHSKWAFFRIWAEKELAKRGKQHIRDLYRNHPEKFFDVEFDGLSKGSSMHLLKCNYIIDETASQKRVCLKEYSQEQIAQQEAYLQKVREYEASIHQHKQLESHFKQEEEASEALLGLEKKA